MKRKKGRKATQLIPAHNGISLVTVLPEQLQSPLLTAEWEHKLQQIERGEMDAEAFLDEIAAMVTELVQDAKAVPGAEVLFPSGRPVVGKCPRCGGDVTESRRGFFCERNECRFALWKDNQFFTYKKLELTTSMASALLADGKAYASGVYSERTGKSYDAYVVMTDDGTRTLYGLEFVR